jgi:hypothetical protein
MKSKPKQLSNGALTAYRRFYEVKEQAVEETFCYVERSNPVYFLAFAIVGAYLWYLAIYVLNGLEQFLTNFPFYSIGVVFLISYFTIYLGSKLVFRVTVDEAEDDTSSFALFSACRRRERRSLFSALLAAFNCAALIVYLTAKDLNRL